MSGFPYGVAHCLRIPCAVPSLHRVSLTHQGLVANVVLHLLMPGERSRGKAGVRVLLFRAPNRMSTAKEEIEIEMRKTYRCLESQKTSAGAAKERIHNRKKKWMRYTGMCDAVENPVKGKTEVFVTRP